MNGSPLSQQHIQDAVEALSVISPGASTDIKRISDESFTIIEQIQQRNKETLNALTEQITELEKTKKPIPTLPKMVEKGKLSGKQLEVYRARMSKHKPLYDAAIKHNTLIDRKIAEYGEDKIQVIGQAAQEIEAIYAGMLDRIQAKITQLLQEATQSLSSGTESLTAEGDESTASVVKSQHAKRNVSYAMFQDLAGNYQSNPGQFLRNMVEHEKDLLKLWGDLHFSPEQLMAMQTALGNARNILPEIAAAQARSLERPNHQSVEAPQPYAGAPRILDAPASFDTDSELELSTPVIHGLLRRAGLWDSDDEFEPDIIESPALQRNRQEPQRHHEEEPSDQVITETKQQSSLNWKMLAVPFAMLTIAIMKDPAARQGLAQGLSESLLSATNTAAQSIAPTKSGPTIFSQTASQALKSTASAAMKKINQ